MDDAERETQALSLLDERQVDGLIICASCLPEQLLLAPRLADIPVVLINRLPTSSSIGAVETDQEAGVRSALQHLIDLGHRRIAYIGGSASSQMYQPRIATFRSACS